MRLPKFNVIERRVGVVGLYRSGKTVFLTSLINHLQNHDPQRFRLGDGEARLTFRHELPPRGFDRFAYLDHRNALVQGQDWPSKTRATSQYRCEFYRSDWHVSRGELALLDVPGERLADIPMAGLGFDAWSDLVLAVFENHAEYRTLAQPYLDMLDDPASRADQILRVYRDTLQRLFVAYRPVISPSTFILGADGSFVGDRGEARRFEGAVCGLDAGRQFAPLSPGRRQRDPSLARQFAGFYGDYRDVIVKPLARGLQRCDRLVVLVDITTLLAGGLGMYEGMRELLRHTIDFLRPGKGLFGVSGDVIDTLLTTAVPGYRSLRSLLGLDWGGIHRVAFVATKADQVHESQRSNLLHLLRDMVDPLIAARLHESLRLRVGHFVASAVKSTRSMPDGRLQGRLLGSDAIQSFTPSSVPAEWPTDWVHGQFAYPPVAPWMPRRRDAAPEQLGLDEVTEFLLSG